MPVFLIVLSVSLGLFLAIVALVLLGLGCDRFAKFARDTVPEAADHPLWVPGRFATIVVALAVIGFSLYGLNKPKLFPVDLKGLYALLITAAVFSIVIAAIPRKILKG